MIYFSFFTQYFSTIGWIFAITPTDGLLNGHMYNGYPLKASFVCFLLYNHTIVRNWDLKFYCCWENTKNISKRFVFFRSNTIKGDGMGAVLKMANNVASYWPSCKSWKLLEFWDLRGSDQTSGQRLFDGFPIWPTPRHAWIWIMD